MTAKTATSSASRPSRMRCGASIPRRRRAGWMTGEDAISAASGVEGVGGDGGQDDQALDGLLPLRLDVQVEQGRADGAQQGDADERAQQRAAPARDRHPAYDDRGDDLELQPR